MNIIRDSDMHALLYAVINKQQKRRFDVFARVTELLMPPTQFVLYRRHEKEIETPASERLWLLFGSAIHKQMEEGMGTLPEGMEILHREQTMYGKYGPYVISGTADVIYRKKNDIVLADYKTTSAWALKHCDRIDDWTLQLNIYASLANQSLSLRPTRLEILVILRDWSAYTVGKEADYPRRPFVTIPIKRMKEKEIKRFILGRAFEIFRLEGKCDEELPECDPKDRWERNGIPVRCERYCLVSKWCRFARERGLHAKLKRCDIDGNSDIGEQGKEIHVCED